MAAPAGGGGSAVSVLAPNGRRHTVKVTPSTVLLQVLEDTCRRQDFNPSEYDLKFQRTVLDLSLQWRFANLPNNAKLEMVPVSRSREGPENIVRIAFQLDDGSRLQDAFCSRQTLWELLSHFAQTRERLQQLGEKTPVCVYMRNEPVDRDPVVYHPDLEDLLQPWPAEVPDEFFEVTVDDVRRRLAQLKSERKRLEEAPLVTKAFREAQMKEKLERYPKVALRVLFPDRYILQGFFRPSETVGDLRDFVRSHLGNPELSFYLFIAPPKMVLDDHTLTLFQANLFPAALVHFGAEEPTGLYLEPGLLEHTVSPSTADVLVARCMSRASGSPPLLPAPDPVSLESEPIAEDGALGPPEPIQGTAQPVKRSLGKVPKWLKLPASKR
ncbi:tether containing UBX domain for GLUT4 isoform 10 [Mus musculus]|uniref:tether containing UBX domain for GLUT4 isoform 10 n=1 Tax=Mus musculus TaxID=10090 RepID=UPI00299E2D6C|nr:tether containing UBX domain for GLUT4 isoform 10 [Mus musculus]